MNISRVIAEKKEAFKNYRKGKADEKMFAQMDEIELIRQEREEREKREIIRNELKLEKGELRRLKFGRFREAVQGVSNSMKEMKQRADKRQDEGRGIFSK